MLVRQVRVILSTLWEPVRGWAPAFPRPAAGCSAIGFVREGPWLLYSLSCTELQKSALKIRHEEGEAQSLQLVPTIEQCFGRAVGTSAIPLVNIRNSCTHVQSFSEYCNYALACTFCCGRLKAVFTIQAAFLHPLSANWCDAVKRIRCVAHICRFKRCCRTERP